MKKIFTVIITACILLTNILIAFGEQLNIDAPSYILIDSKSGKVLYEHNADARRYPASTTKMMTAILALEKGKPDQIMTASQAAVNDIGVDGMNIGIMAGEQIDMDHLLHALLISSANETANIIAENISSARKDFVKLMNEKAAELGATGTHFVNPCGAHDKDHYTTARDLAAIAKYGMTLPKFREIVHEKSYSLEPTNKHKDWPVLASTNKLLGTKSEYFTDVLGVKTGYTGPAGYNLVSAATDSNGTELIAVVMGVRPNAGYHAIFKFSKTLLDYGFKNYASKNLLTINDVVKSVQVLNAKEDLPLDLVAQSSFSQVMPKDQDMTAVTSEVKLNTEIKAPVKQGDILGQIEYRLNNEALGKVNLIASRNIEEKPAAIKAVQNTLSNNSMVRYMIISALLLAVFGFARFYLRKLSKRIHSKKEGYE